MGRFSPSPNITAGRTSASGSDHQITGSLYVQGDISASVNVSGSSFYGDGSNLTGLSSGGGISWDGSTANGVATFKDADEATVESNLTFDGSTLTVTGDTTSTGNTILGNASSDYHRISGSLSISGSQPIAAYGMVGGAVPGGGAHDVGNASVIARHTSSLDEWQSPISGALVVSAHNWDSGDQANGAVLYVHSQDEAALIGFKNANTLVSGEQKNAVSNSTAKGAYVGLVNSDIVLRNEISSGKVQINCGVVEVSVDDLGMKVGSAATDQHQVTGSLNVRKLNLVGNNAQFTASLGIDPQGTALNSIQVGNNNGAVAIGSLNISFGGNVIGEGSTAIGAGRPQATGPAALSIGSGSKAAVAAIGLGQNASASALHSIAIGPMASGSAVNTISIGSSSVASAANAISYGTMATASKPSAIAIGNNAKAITQRTIAIGDGNSAGAHDSIVLGQNITTINNYTTVIGQAAQGGGVAAVSIGSSSAGGAKNAIAIGTSPSASGVNAIAIGSSSTATGRAAVVLGAANTGSANYTTIIGYNNNASVEFNIVLGFGSTATRQSAINIGKETTTIGYNAIAIGSGSKATATNAIAIGAGAYAAHPNTMVIGSGSYANNTTGSSVVFVSGSVTASVGISSSFIAQTMVSQSVTGALFVDCSEYNVFNYVLTAPSTALTASDLVAGASYVFWLRQDGTGTRKLTFKNFKWAGGSAPTLTTTAGKIDMVSGISDGVNMYADISKDFA
tara:strand:- start:371 stop:2584 length:2214 start_codon:yes stop_codon:yes gene_type:complete